MASNGGSPDGISIALGRTANDTIHHGSTFRSQGRDMAIIVDATARFGCRHRFVVTEDDGLLLFVCESCDHRTDLLPVHLDSVRGQIVKFPVQAVGAMPAAAVAAPPARASQSTQKRG
jgi:hypothetical protein